MIQLDIRSSKPIYEQVKDSIRKLIVSELMLPGEKLPSVRQLAGELAINPNTIQRAYNDLETEGFIISVAGKGNFVADGKEQTAERKQEVKQKILPMLVELKSLGLNEQELLEMWKGIQNDRN